MLNAIAKENICIYSHTLIIMVRKKVAIFLFLFTEEKFIISHKELIDLMEIFAFKRLPYFSELSRVHIHCN